MNLNAKCSISRRDLLWSHFSQTKLLDQTKIFFNNWTVLKYLTRYHDIRCWIEKVWITWLTRSFNYCHLQCLINYKYHLDQNNSRVSPFTLILTRYSIKRLSCQCSGSYFCGVRNFSHVSPIQVELSSIHIHAIAARKYLGYVHGSYFLL